MQGQDTDNMGALAIDPHSLENDDHVNFDENLNGPAQGPPHAGTGGSSKMRPRPLNQG